MSDPHDPQSRMENFGQPPRGPSVQFPPGPPPPPGRGPKPRSGWRVIGRILFVLMGAALCFSLIGNCILSGAVAALTGGAGEAPSSKATEITVVSGGRDKVAILPAEGTVDDSMTERVKMFIDAIRADKTIKAVVVEVDSPGGTITASDEIHHLLTDFKTQDQMKLVVCMRSLAASGGYYLSMPADKIYAEPTTMTGSIGVIWPAFEVSGLLEKIGVTPEMIASDQAVWKETGSPFKKFTDEDRKYIKDLVNQAHARFSDVVAKGRAGKLTKPMSEIAIGRVWTADDALKLGLIDEIAYPDKVYQDTAAMAGISNPTVVRLRPRAGLIELLSASSNVGSAKVQIDPKMIFEMQTPRMEYRYVDPAVLGGH